MVISSKLPIVAKFYSQRSIGNEPGKITFGMYGQPQDQFTPNASRLEELVKNPKCRVSDLTEAAEDCNHLLNNPKKFKIIKSLINACVGNANDSKLYLKLVALRDKNIPFDHSPDSQETEFDLLINALPNNPNSRDKSVLTKCVNFLLQNNIVPYEDLHREDKKKLAEIIQKLGHDLCHSDPQTTDTYGITHRDREIDKLLEHTPYAYLSPLCTDTQARSSTSGNFNKMNIYTNKYLTHTISETETPIPPPTRPDQIIPFLQNCKAGTIGQSVEQVLNAKLNLTGMENEIYDAILQRTKEHIKNISKNEQTARSTKKQLNSLFTSNKNLLGIVWRSIGLTSKRDARDIIRTDAFEGIELLTADKILPTWETTPKKNLDKLCSKFRFTKGQKDQLQSYYKHDYPNFYNNQNGADSTSSISSMSSYEDSGSEVSEDESDKDNKMDVDSN